MHRACHTASAARSGGIGQVAIQGISVVVERARRDRRVGREKGRQAVTGQIYSEMQPVFFCLPTPYHQVTIRPYIANFVITDGHGDG